MNRCWRLDDSRQTLVLASQKDHLAEVIYWGPRLPVGEDLASVLDAHAIDVTGGMLDLNPELSICPEATRSFPGQPGLILRDSGGQPLLPKFCFESADEGDNALTLVFRDLDGVLTNTAEFAIDSPKDGARVSRRDLNFPLVTNPRGDISHRRSTERRLVVARAGSRRGRLVIGQRRGSLTIADLLELNAERILTRRSRRVDSIAR